MPKARKVPSLPALAVPPRNQHQSDDAVFQPSHSQQRTSVASIDEGLEELERLRLSIDLNLKLRPLAPTSPSQYYTPAVAFFSEANHPLPIEAAPLLSRMLCSPRPLLLDMRPSQSFLAFRLKYALNVYVPPETDPSYIAEMTDFRQFITSETGRRELDDLLNQSYWDGDAVVYDDERTLGDNSPTWQVMELLMPVVKGQVWYLEGGMSAASVLPRFQLMVVTADEGSITPSHEKTSKSQQPRKRSVPNLRRLETNAIQPTREHVAKQQIQGSQSTTPSADFALPTTFSPPVAHPSSAFSDASNALLTPRGYRPESEDVLDISTIIPGFLYLGPEPVTPAHADALHAKPVTRILNVAEECEDILGLATSRRFDRYRRLPLKDTIEEENVQAFLRESSIFLDDARLHGAPTYVHCKAGKSRSVMAVIGYLIHSHRWTLSKAYAFVRQRREGVSPNIGFVSELMSYEEEELGGRPSGAPFSAVADSGDNHNSLNGKRPGNVRESLPPFFSSANSKSDYHGPKEGVTVRQETEVRDAGGRYRYQRRAPVDETTLQPVRRVSKAGLESLYLSE